MYATAMSVDAKYYCVHAGAAQAIMTAEIYLQSALLQLDPQPPTPVIPTHNTEPDNLMDVGEQGRETGDEQVLVLNVPQDDMDQLYEGIEEHPLKPSATGDLRDRADPVADDVEMAKNPQGNPVAPPEEVIVNTGAPPEKVIVNKTA